MRRIPFLNFADLNSAYKDEILNTVSVVLGSGHYILGEMVHLFEHHFSKYCGVGHAVGTGNGLDALTLIMRGYKELGILNDGDEVIVPANTYIATILAITA